MAEKTCAVCQRDCSDRPRIKDKKGRYICKECVDARKAQMKQQAMVAPDEPTNVMAGLVDEVAAMTPKACPQCSTGMTSDAIVCLNCGYNTETDKQAKTRISSAKATKEEKAQGPGFEMTPKVAAIASILLYASVGAIGAVNQDLMLPGLAVVWLYGAVAWIWGIIEAFKDEGKWGLIALLSHVVPCLGLVFLWYLICVVPNLYVRVMTVCSFVGGFVLVGAALAIDPDFFTKLTEQLGAGAPGP